MATLTVRNLPDALALRLKQLAKEHDCSTEQEVRNILQEKLESRSDLLARITQRVETLPSAKAKDVAGWIANGRTRTRA